MAVSLEKWRGYRMYRGWMMTTVQTSITPTLHLGDSYDQVKPNVVCQTQSGQGVWTMWKAQVKMEQKHAKIKKFLGFFFR